MSKLNYSPKLRKTAEEIKQILIREDIAGIIVLHDIVSREVNNENIGTNGMCEYIIHLTPSYSKLLPEPNGGFRFRDKEEDYSNQFQRQIRMGPTYNLIESFTDLLSMITYNFMELHDKIKKNIIPGKGGKHYPKK